MTLGNCNDPAHLIPKQTGSFSFPPPHRVLHHGFIVLQFLINPHFYPNSYFIVLLLDT